MTTSTGTVHRGARFPLTRLERIEAGKALQKLRLERNIKQSEMAEAIGFKSQSNISHIETGMKALSPGRLKAAADFLGVEQTDIMDERGTIAEVAKEFGVTTQEVRRRVKDGTLHFVTLAPRMIRISWASAEEVFGEAA